MTFIDITLKLLGGFGITLALFFLTLLLALPLGLVLTFGSMSKFAPLRYLTQGFIYVIRGTPLILQLMVVVYFPGLVFGAPITKWAIFGGNPDVAYFFGALAGFVINYSCYFSEIYRGGIENIPKGQYEACQVLGMTKRQAFFKVILLQVVKHILPPISNEVVTLVKDTALARTIGVLEMYYCAGEVLARESIIWPLFYAGLFYLIFNGLASFLMRRLEHKLDYFKA